MSVFAKETLPISLESEMRRSYLDYAMSVIVGRALPDVRDGLKPVHRRVLYAMHELSNAWNRPYKKSASPDRAISILRDEAARGKLDASLVDLFSELVSAGL